MFVSLYSKIDVGFLLFKCLTRFILDWYPIPTFISVVTVVVVKKGESEKFLSSILLLLLYEIVKKLVTLIEQQN